MTATRFILIMLVGGVMLAPPLAFSHGIEFLSARLTLLDQGSTVELHLTADYGGNPLLADEAAAREALQEVLRVEHGGHIQRLAEVAPLTLERVSDWQNRLPDSLIPAATDIPHQLLVATWRWQPPRGPIHFSIPKGSIHDVLLWRRLPNAETETILLIAGDRSAAIPIQPSDFLLAWQLGAISAIALWWAGRRWLLTKNRPHRSRIE